jgi:hypothetical protein
VKINMGGDVVASQFLEGRGLNMERKVLYQQATGWITIHVSDYHAWQGHISGVPDRFLGYIFETETIVTGKVT